MTAVQKLTALVIVCGCCSFSRGAELWAKDPGWVESFVQTINEKRFSDQGLAQLHRLSGELLAVKVPSRDQKIRIGLLYRSRCLRTTQGFDAAKVFASYDLGSRKTYGCEALVVFCSSAGFDTPASQYKSLKRKHADELLRLYPKDLDLLLNFNKVSARDQLDPSQQNKLAIPILAGYRKAVHAGWKADYVELSYYRDQVYAYRRMADIVKCEELIPRYRAHQDLPKMLRDRLPRFEKFLKAVKEYVLKEGK